MAYPVRAAVETVQPLFEEQEHKLTLMLPPDKRVFVVGDAVRLTQIIENLLTNAAKYTNQGGKIELMLEADHDRARITIRDNGIGMSSELIPHVFEVFTQAPRTLDRAKGGMGLGLPLVQRLVQMHGGEVTADSPGLDKGSVFVVTFPCTCQPPLAEADGRDRESIPPRSGQVHSRRIMVVDDEKETAAILAELLEEGGHQAIAVNSGAAALAAVASFDPEVVLLDLGLPGMDGYEVAKKLREQHKDRAILLVALTGYQRDSERLEQAGFDDHLIKPTSWNSLSALLNKKRPRKHGSR